MNRTIYLKRYKIYYCSNIILKQFLTDQFSHFTAQTHAHIHIDRTDKKSYRERHT